MLRGIYPQNIKQIPNKRYLRLHFYIRSFADKQQQLEYLECDSTPQTRTIATSHPQNFETSPYSLPGRMPVFKYPVQTPDIGPGLRYKDQHNELLDIGYHAPGKDDVVENCVKAKSKEIQEKQP